MKQKQTTIPLLHKLYLHIAVTCVIGHKRHIHTVASIRWGTPGQNVCYCE